MAAWDHEGAEPLVCYFHIWELDPEQPRISAVSALEHMRQYRNLRLMSDRIRYYLNRYRFGPIAEYLELPVATPIAESAPTDGDNASCALRARSSLQRDRPRHGCRLL